MELSDESLKKLIAYIIKKVQEELNQTKVQEEIFIILTDGWKPQYPAFFEAVDIIDGIVVNTVIPPDLENEYIQKIRCYKSCGRVLLQNEINMRQLNCFTSVFPAVPREIIVKTALGIDDIFETKWIRNCFAKGQKIIFLSSGLEKFTGKEPLKYVQTIQGYFKTVLEYGIEIRDKFNPYEAWQPTDEKLNQPIDYLK